MSLTKELQSYPLLWQKITNGTSMPDVELMIQLLKSAGFTVQNRPSGSVCIKSIFQYKEEIEAYLKANTEPEKEESIMQENIPEPEPIISEEKPSLPEEKPNIPEEIFPFDPYTQCESTLESEAVERLKACIATSFRTDAGIIMLENDLSMFEDADDYTQWVETMRSSWKDRLHSKISGEFNEALDLWVASKLLI